MDEVMNIGNELLGQADGNSSIFIAGTVEFSMTALIVMAVVGLLICFFGLKVVKALAVLSGFGFGAGLGLAAAAMLGLSGTAFYAVAAAGGIVVGALSFFLRRFGIFLMAFVYGVSVCVMVIQPYSAGLWIVCAAVGIVLAVLAAVFIEPAVVLVTGITGGLLAGEGITAVLGLAKLSWLGYAVGAVLAVTGILVQFMMHSRKIGKKEKVHSKKVKAQVSRESEVEKARRMLEEDEGDEDDM